MRRYSAFAAFVLVVSLATGAHADIWKWVDARGVVHYSDRPVPGAVLIKGHLDARDAASSPDAGDGQAKLEARSQQVSAELDKEAAERAVHKDEATVRAAQCKQAKANYQRLIQARRIYSAGSDGQRDYLSDQQADQMRLKARMDMDSACGSNTQ